MSDLKPPARGGRFGSVRYLIFGAIGVVFVINLVLLGWSAASSWQRYRQASGQVEFDRASHAFISGLYEVLLERVATGNALRAREPADAAVLADIAAHRAIVKGSFETGLASIRALTFPNRESLLAELDAKLAKANDFSRAGRRSRETAGGSAVAAASR